MEEREFGALLDLLVDVRRIADAIEAYTTNPVVIDKAIPEKRKDVEDPNEKCPQRLCKGILIKRPEEGNYQCDACGASFCITYLSAEEVSTYQWGEAVGESVAQKAPRAVFMRKRIHEH